MLAQKLQPPVARWVDPPERALKLFSPTFALAGPISEKTYWRGE
jgi:hypothetical protein